MFWMLLLVALIRLVFYFSSMETRQGGDVTAASTYFSILIVYFLLVLLPMMQIFTSVNPIRWYVVHCCCCFFLCASLILFKRVVKYVLADYMSTALCIYWLSCIAIMVMFVANSKVSHDKFKLCGFQVPKIIVRKFFHVMTLLMFIPGLLLRVCFLFTCTYFYSLTFYSLVSCSSAMV